jgi:hypothetical protein
MPSHIMANQKELKVKLEPVSDVDVFGILTILYLVNVSV